MVVYNINLLVGCILVMCSVTFHGTGIQFPREGFIIVVSLILLGHIKMWRVRLSWDSRVTCSRVSQRALYRERRL